MKRIVCLAVLAFLLSFTGNAQYYSIAVTGVVTDMSAPNPMPVANQAVNILVDSTGNSFFYQNTVYTNPNGFFIDTINLPPNVGMAFITVSTFDQCMNEYQYLTATWAAGTMPPPFDFFICQNFPPGRQAMFFWDYNPSNPYSLQFFDMSVGSYTQRLWDFGDGNTSTEDNPVHVYSEAGLYEVCLSISDDSNTCSNTACEYVQVGQNTWGCENFFMYEFSDSTTAVFTGYVFDSVNEVLSYDWDFGDGTTGSGQTVSHTFTPTGGSLYIVCLNTVSVLENGDTCSSVSCQDVFLGFPPPPLPCESFFNASNQMGLTVDFEAFTMSMFPTDFDWEFGDNTIGTGQFVSHTYPQDGMYMVTLHSVDSTGCESEFIMEVFVGGMPQGCDNNFIYNKIDTLTYEFSGEVFWNDSTNAYQTDYFWDFGDGTTGSGQNITHTFQGNPNGGMGIYTVCLTTYSYSNNFDSCLAVSCQDIFINGGGWDCMNWFDYWQDGLNVNFTGFTMNMLPATYTWEFGDGTSGTGQEISHTYGAAGIYLVTLSTEDSTGCAWTSTMEVWVDTYPNFAVFGYVYLSNNNVADDATVRLMGTDSLWQNVVEEGSTTVNDSGFYFFDSIPMNNNRMYFVQAELNEGSAWYGQYLPTYHLSALNWQEAMPVLPLNNWTHDIFMIEGTSTNSGSGMITGNVTSLNTRGVLPEVEVMLMDESLNPFYYVRSDENGEFSFDNLAFGNYMIYAELPGIETDPALITLSSEQPESHVEIQVADGEVNYVFGISERLVLLSGVGEAYPNPTSGISSIEISSKSPVSLELALYNQTGQAVWTNTTDHGAGSHTIQLGTAALPSGFYYLKVTSKQGDFVTRRIVKR